MSGSPTPTEPPLYAKQPLFNRELEVIGYELLFRPQESLSITDGNNATAQVLLNSFTSDDPVLANEDLAIFVNFTAAWIIQGVPIDRPNCVIEVLEDVNVTPLLTSSIRAMKHQGNKIALDDFDLSLSTSQLLPEADIVKIDVLNLPKTEIKNTVRVLKRHKVTLVAEKVETQEMFEWLLPLGFEIFQGYFFCKPEQRHDKLVKPPKQTTLSLLAALMKPEVEFDDIAHELKSDPVLTVKLLQLVNSSRYARVNKVKNLEEAVVIMGLDQLKRWVSLIALTDLDNKPPELIRFTLVCAYAMEIFATDLMSDIGLSATDCFFVGFLSRLDAHFDRPLPELISKLPLDPVVMNAIVHRQGKVGEMLTLIDNLMLGNWDALEKQPVNVPMAEIFRTFLRSEQEADSVYQILV